MKISKMCQCCHWYAYNSSNYCVSVEKHTFIITVVST